MARKRTTSQSPEGQISLFASKETPDAFRKAVQIVHSKPKQPLSLLQRKLGNAWAKHAIENSPDEHGWWVLGIRDLAIDVGSAMRIDTRTQVDIPEESLMLTGDENIADVKFRVIWKIDDQKPEDYAFNISNPPATVKAVAESAMREIVGRSQIQKLLTAERKVIEPQSQELMQRVLDGYKAGVKIVQVQLLSVDPPQSVIAAFRDVTAAQQDLQRLGNEAEAYANRVVPEARGAAARIMQEAEAYREQTVAEARGQAGRFDKIYAQYKNAPALTRQRLYIETMERVLGGAEKVVLDDPSKGGASVALESSSGENGAQIWVGMTVY